MKPIIILCIIFISCGEHREPDWRMAPLTYKCTEKEMNRVMREAEWCVKTTDYNGQFCYGTSIIRICKDNNPPTEVKE